jgi:hypothetical protein
LLICNKKPANKMARVFHDVARELEVLHRRVRAVEVNTFLLEAKTLALYTASRAAKAATWLEHLIINTLWGAVIFVFYISTLIEPIVILVLVAIVGYFSRLYLWGPLCWVILKIMRFVIQVYNTIADAFDFIIDAVNKAVAGISSVGTFGLATRHHIIPKSVNLPHHSIHDVFPGDVYSFFDDPVGFCRTRANGFEFVWGIAMRYSHPEMCFTCKALSLSPYWEWACEVAFFGEHMYHYKHVGCDPIWLDFVCQIVYIDALAELILSVMFFGMFLISFRSVVGQYLQIAGIVLRCAFEIVFELFSVCGVARHLFRGDWRTRQNTPLKQRLLDITRKHGSHHLQRMYHFHTQAQNVHTNTHTHSQMNIAHEQ